MVVLADLTPVLHPDKGPPIHVVEIQRKPGACGAAKQLDRGDVQALVDRVTDWRSAEADFLTEHLGTPAPPVAPESDVGNNTEVVGGPNPPGDEA